MERRTQARWTEELHLPDQPEIVTQLARVQLFLTQALEDITGAFGVSAADYYVVGVVSRADNHRTSPTRVCEVLGRTTGGLTPAIDRLEAAGLLRRLPDPDDRRRVTLEATAAGRQLTEKVNRALESWQSSLDLDETVATSLQQNLDHLLDRLQRRTDQ